MKIFKLFLDDLREVKDIYPDALDGEFIVARNFEDAMVRVLVHGIPEFISFDNDLGENEKEGYDFAKWLVECEMDGVLEFPKNFDYHVHSANPKAWANIPGYFNSYFDQKEAA